MKRNRVLILLAAIVITVSLLQASLVLACSSQGGTNGQGNGNPGGKCDSDGKSGVSFSFSNDPKCGIGGGPNSVLPGLQ